MRKKTISQKETKDILCEQSLEAAALTVKRVRMQLDAEPDNENVLYASKSSEETMFMLALDAAGDDEEKTVRILSRYGLEDLN